MFRSASAAVVLAVLLASGAAMAQQAADFSKVVIKTTNLGHGTYMLEGQGGNITVVVAADGVLMVDSEYAPLHDKIKAAIAQLTDQPIRYVVDTHFHGDHTGGNALLAKDGATVVAHVNVKTRLAAGTTAGLTGAKTPPAPAGALPTRTYTSALTLKLKDRTVQLRHIANAHTDGDTYVWIPDANVLATGDTVTIGRYPNIDFANGGNIKGMIAATDAYLKLVNDDTKIVPGHGPLTDKQTVTQYRAMLVTARDRMAKLIQAGQTEEQVTAAKPFADLDKAVGATDQQAQGFVRNVYHSLKPSE